MPVTYRCPSCRSENVCFPCWVEFNTRIPRPDLPPPIDLGAECFACGAQFKFPDEETVAQAGTRPEHPSDVELVDALEKLAERYQGDAGDTCPEFERAQRLIEKFNRDSA